MTILKNGNVWPTVITILLTMNLAGIGYLAARINTLSFKLDVINERSIKNENDLKNYENQARREEDNFAKKSWVLEYFERKK